MSQSYSDVVQTARDYYNSEDADKAIQALNGYEMDGRQLNVNEARERSGGGGRRF